MFSSRCDSSRSALKRLCTAPAVFFALIFTFGQRFEYFCFKPSNHWDYSVFSRVDVSVKFMRDSRVGVMYTFVPWRSSKIRKLAAENENVRIDTEFCFGFKSSVYAVAMNKQKRLGMSASSRRGETGMTRVAGAVFFNGGFVGVRYTFAYRVESCRISTIDRIILDIIVKIAATSEASRIL